MMKQYMSLVVLEYYTFNELTQKLSTSSKRKYVSDAHVVTYLFADGLDIELKFEDIGIEFKVQIRLVQGELTIRIPNDSIVEDVNKIVSLDLFPHFGSTISDEVKGYTLIPDGPGALYRFKDNAAKEPVQFSARYYGADQGIRPDGESVSQSNLSMPIFGMVHGINQQGFLGIIESGDTSAQYTLIPSGANGVNYNSSYVHFILRESYVFPTNNKGDGITTVSEDRFVSDMAIRYHFVSGEDANYVGLANTYSDYLKTNGTLTALEEALTRLRLEVLQSDSEPGIIGMKNVTMSTVSSTEKMINQLIDQAVKLEVVLRGWNQGGMSGQSPYKTSFSKDVGSNRAFETLIATLNENNIPISLYVDYVNAYQTSSRPSSSFDLARGIYLKQIVRTNINLLYPEEYFLDPLSTLALMKKDVDFFSDLAVSLTHDGIGNLLFSTYADGKWWNREASVALYLEALSYYEPQPMIKPNAYLWRYVSTYYDIPLYASQYSFYDDTIPFLTLVLRGKMKLYSPYMNYFANPLEQFLILLDYGISPSYIVTNAPTTDLRYTQASKFFSTTYSEWEAKIVTSYETISSVLDLVSGAEVESRIVLATGVVSVNYSNGIHIYINYGDQPYDDGTREIAPKGYFVEVTS